jgi:hypothetical protein
MNGNKAPCILKLNTRWRYMDSFWLLPLHHWRISTHCVQGWVGPRLCVAAIEKKSILPMLERNCYSSQPSIREIVITLYWNWVFQTAVFRAQVYHNQNKVYTFHQNNEIIRH